MKGSDSEAMNVITLFTGPPDVNGIPTPSLRRARSAMAARTKAPKAARRARLHVPLARVMPGKPTPVETERFGSSVRTRGNPSNDPPQRSTRQWRHRPSIPPNHRPLPGLAATTERRRPPALCPETREPERRMKIRCQRHLGAQEFIAEIVPQQWLPVARTAPGSPSPIRNRPR